MIVLIDENLPHALRHGFSGHDVSTVFFRGWSGKKNGELIALCEQSGVDALVAADQSLAYQQNLRARRLAVVVLPTNEPAVLEPMMARILQAVEQVTAGKRGDRDVLTDPSLFIGPESKRAFASVGVGGRNYAPLPGHALGPRLYRCEVASIKSLGIDHLPPFLLSLAFMRLRRPSPPAPIP